MITPKALNVNIKLKPAQFLLYKIISPGTVQKLRFPAIKKEGDSYKQIYILTPFGDNN